MPFPNVSEGINGRTGQGVERQRELRVQAMVKAIETRSGRFQVKTSQTLRNEGTANELALSMGVQWERWQ